MEAATFRSAEAEGFTPLSLYPNFILPENQRPLLSQVQPLSSVPIIDMNGEDSTLAREVSLACEEFGFFQVLNHGVPPDLCRKMMAAASEFFRLPREERAALFTEDKTKAVRLTNYFIKVEGQENVSMWSESFSHPWHPSDSGFTHLLPLNPPQYREAVAEYAKEMGGLMSRLLGLISLGLGLEKDCMEKKIGEDPRLVAQVNYYPPCPDPELTMGLPVHTDLNALTVLLQSGGVRGLQVIKDGRWVAVDPVPDAFVVNLGDQIQVMSNGRYKSVHHRAVSNRAAGRMSVGMFYGPNSGTVVGPIEELLDEQHPPLYRSYLLGEFLREFHKQDGQRRMVKELFQLHHHTTATN
ncbi:protein DOWNY MILDEW RESISTANCE 6-like [Diospyros lotus]|uniref:protein DOWNY MILDEW RESISTANCE 6-like n=1 Tax=Diospyros lotus TaxID=55363 RepID=UPI0022501441|nr:protein DOWNY MILDEW RESISTANCE 6-like [Diospyros lotus]